MFNDITRNNFLSEYAGVLICKNNYCYGTGKTGYLIKNTVYRGDWEYSYLERVCNSSEAETNARVFGIILEKHFEIELKRFKAVGGQIEFWNPKRKKYQKKYSEGCVAQIARYASFDSVMEVYAKLGLKVKTVLRQGKRTVYSFEKYK